MPRYIFPAIFLSLAVLACNAPAATQPTPGITEIMPLPDTPLPTDAATAAPTDPAPTATTAAPVEGGLTMSQLMNATYQTEMVPSGVATLADGHYQEYNPDLRGNTAFELLEPVGFGDVNGDGAYDALVRLLIHTEATTGRFSVLYVMLNQGGTPAQAASVWLGDRIILNAITVDADGLITVDMIVSGPNDGACCPNTPEIRKYRLEGSELVLIE